MNYLAHIALSGEDMEVAVGNFMGDGVKGAIPEGYPLGIKIGLHLHRFIDHQSDTHPENLAMRVALREKYSKYAGVVQDMYHDHFLSRYWDEFHPVQLQEFLQGFYQSAELNISHLPARQRLFFLGMREGEWMFSYGSFSGLGRAFQGLSTRNSTAFIMKDGASYLEEHYEIYEKGFMQWYPILLDLCEKERKTLLRNLSNSR
jgi:acyl carrier protein phosphodiesterase